MTGDNVEALCAAVATIDIAQSTEETCFEDKSLNKPSSTNPSGAPIRTVIRRVPHSRMEQFTPSPVQQLINNVVKETQSSNANNDERPTNNTTRTRKDSHSVNDNDDSTNNLLEVKALKSEIETLKQQNKDLKKKVARYKVEMEKAHSENRSTKKELENKEADLLDCQQELESAEQSNWELQRLYGMENIDFDEISAEFDNVKFQKIYNDNYSTKFTLETEFKVTICTNLNFPGKTWKERSTGRLREGYDDGAVAVVNISEQFYAAKCGREQENCNSFIDKERWTNEVILLSRVIGLELKRGWAQHAELQLIAFCITRFLEKRGFSMADLKNPNVYEAGPKPPSPVTIYVSQLPCEECRGFINKIHEVVGKYGWWFNPVDRRRYGASPGLEIGQRTRASSEYLV